MEADRCEVTLDHKPRSTLKNNTIITEGDHFVHFLGRRLLSPHHKAEIETGQEGKKARLPPEASLADLGELLGLGEGGGGVDCRANPRRRRWQS